MDRNESYVPRAYEKIASLSTTIGNVLLWPFVFLNLYVGKMPMFFVALGFVVMITIFYVLFRNNKNFSLWSTSVIILLGITVAFVFGDGGLQETGHLWVFVFPLLTYELKGHKNGNKYIVGFYVLLALVYLFSRVAGFTPAYQTPLFILVFFIVLLSVTAFLYGHQKIKNKNETFLIQNKNKYEALFNDLSHGVIMLNRDFKIVEANNTIKSWFPQLKTDEMLCYYETFHPECQVEAGPDCPVDKCFRSGQVNITEQKKITREGEKFYRLVANPMKDEKGEVYAVIETREDITQQKRIQSELTQREETFRTLVSSLSDMVYTLDSDQKLTGLFGDWVTPMGLTSEYLLGKTSLEIFGKESSKVHESANQKALAGETVVYEWSVERNGSVSYYHTSVSPLLSQDNEVTGLVGVGRDITKLKNYEIFLKQSRQRFHQLAVQTGSMNFEIDLEGLYKAISPVVKDLLGYEPDEVVGKMHFWDLFPEDKRDVLTKEVFARLKSQNPITDYVNELVRKDGKRVWVSTNSFPLFNEINELIGYWGVDRDITEQTELSQAIKYQSALQSLVSEISRMFVPANNDNINQLVSGALQKAGAFFNVGRSFIYRFKTNGENYKLAFEWCAPGVEPTPEQIRKETSFTDFPWWHKQIIQNKPVIIADTARMPEEATREKQALLSMNVKSLVCFPVADHKQITGFVGFDTYYEKGNWTEEQIGAMQLIAKILSDTLGKNKAEQALIQSERLNRETAIRYQTYIEASNTGAWEYNRSKGYLWCSPQYFKMLGRDINDYDFSGKPNAEIIWKELIHPDDLMQGKGMLHYYLEKPQGTYQQTFRMLHKDGHYRWILSRGRMLTDENGKITEVFIGTHIDISHQKSHEEALLVKNKELESYLYVASHDLRAPLVNIQGFSNRIQKQIGQLESLVLQNNIDETCTGQMDTILRSGLPQSLSFIVSNVQKMDSLINGLLAISRTGRMKMNVTEVDANALFQKVVKNFNFQIEEINAHVSVDTLLPCYGDYQLLYQLFSNLFDNALKYHHPEKPLNISVKSEKKGGKVIYIFKDTGIGINSRDLDRIWDVFYQVDPHSPTRGEGIGLNLVEKIAEKHKGVVRVESGEGEGSTFFVELHARLFVH